MRKFEYFDHTADVGIFAYGKDEAELFQNCALATTERMVNVKDVAKKVEKNVSLSSKTIEGLLYDLLGEIIFLKDSESLLLPACSVKITHNKEYKLDATFRGDKINPKSQELRNDVKAVTMHMFKIEKVKVGFKATFILDI